MKLEDQVCSLELAKRLKELGVKQQSYFIWKELGEYPNSEWKVLHLHLDFSPPFNHPGYFSAFTVAELGEMLPKDLDMKKDNMTGAPYGLRLYMNGIHRCVYMDRDYKWIHTTVGDTEADARAKMLIHLIEKGIIKP